MAEPQPSWAHIEWNENDQPYAPNYADGYFGEADPVAEARHVFCEGLALPEAWEGFFEDENTFRIVELGFGTGLNFLQTALLWQEFWQEWQKQKTDKQATDKQAIVLDYWGIEAHPLRLEDLQRFYCQHQVEGAESLLEMWKELSRSFDENSCPTLVCRQIAPSLRLTLLLQDVDSALANLSSRLPCEVDGWYCDGFAPRSNPAMWSEKVFAALARCTRARRSFPQLASFSVAKSVRTAANAYGFRTHKRKGLMTKREVLQGFFEGCSQPAPLLEGDRA